MAFFFQNLSNCVLSSTMFMKNFVIQSTLDDLVRTLFKNDKTLEAKYLTASQDCSRILSSYIRPLATSIMPSISNPPTQALSLLTCMFVNVKNSSLDNGNLKCSKTEILKDLKCAAEYQKL